MWIYPIVDIYIPKCIYPNVDIDIPKCRYTQLWIYPIVDIPNCGYVYTQLWIYPIVDIPNCGYLYTQMWIKICPNVYSLLGYSPSGYTQQGCGVIEMLIFVFYDLGSTCVPIFSSNGGPAILVKF